MTLRDYELMYIVRPTVADDELAGTTGKVETIIKGLGGEVSERSAWGKRRLAYPIAKFDDGFYIIEQIKLDPSRTRDLEEQLRISDDVIRHILIV